MLHATAIVLAAAPALVLLLRFAIDGFGANPIEDLTHVSGRWALRLVLISLAITPLRRFFGWKWIAPLRRTFGLAGFAYALVHFLTWSVLDHGLDAEAVLEDLSKRPYVMAGMAAFSMLLILALTSTRQSMRRLGRRWGQLHRIVYVAAILGVIHHFWLIKADYRPALVHGFALVLLLGARILWIARRRAKSA